ncbi:MAG: MFS transporter [Ruminococcaceae bacterium]|nr:MFS transporter [Oscillospiraceae bacterium]
MYSLLIAVIYLAFIGLGLPDSLLGSAWPKMVTELNAPLSYAGIVSTIIALGTIVSSLLSDKLTLKLGAGRVTLISVALTAAALFGFSFSTSFVWLCILAVPYGLGAGAVDAALNNYVALHYSSRHMSWLHCFWGVGATVGPYIMGYAISVGNGWRYGYGTVACIQAIIALVLLLSLPLWKSSRGEDNAAEEAPIGIKDALKIKGVKSILFAFFAYCGAETTAGLWASSYLVTHKGVAVDTAASFASLFYLGITAGRFISGFFADRVGDKNMIRLGTAVMASGLALVLLPVENTLFTLVGLTVIGLGAAPVYPAIIHATPANFGKENSHAVVGIQMASAYCGSVAAPPLFGIIAQYSTMWLYPYYLVLFALLMFTMTERVNKTCSK